MTNYVETQSVAHIMNVDQDCWRSVCRVDLRLRAANYRDHWELWPLRSVWSLRGEAPSKPWCKWCVIWARRQAEELIRSVLIPSGAWPGSDSRGVA